MQQPDQRADREAPRARGLVWTVALLALVAIGAWLFVFRHPTPTAAPQSARSTAPAEEATADETPTHEPSQPVLPRTEVATRRRAAEITASPSTDASAAPANSEAAAILNRLMQTDNKPLTAEQAAAVKRDLQHLVAQGPAGVEAIRQFLQQNKDLSLDELKSGAQVGYPTLRAGLFDALHQIGDAQAQSTLLDVLRSTADPAEIGLLAKHLEDLAPGEHRDDILTAARETLGQLAQRSVSPGATPGASKPDVGPLFQILQGFGNPNAVADIQQGMAQWKNYGLMALANLPEGQGVPALINEAQRLGSSGVVQDVFAVQMLAQAAAQSPDASAALIAEAKAGQIPDRAWRRIADALAGDQYQFARDANSDPAVLAQTPGLKTYHIEAGNENFYSVPLGPSDPTIPQRAALVDQLLSATSNPAAAAALQQARTQLRH